MGTDKAAENWQITSQALGLKPDTAFSVRMRVLHGGHQEGVSIVDLKRKLFNNNHLNARGGLEPAFRVLFSAIFQGVSLGNFHQGRKLRKVAEAKVWSILVNPRTFFMCVFIIFYLPSPAL